MGAGPPIGLKRVVGDSTERKAFVHRDEPLRSSIHDT